MKRRKNLERAIVLGLLLSTSVYGSAWAEPINGSITDDRHNGTYNEDVIVNADDDSAIEIDDDTISIKTEAPITDGTGKIELNSNKYGIRLDGNGSVTLTAVGDNVIEVTANSTDSEIGDGINVTENAGGTITLNGANNTITVVGEHSDGIYTDTGSTTNINLIATSENNTISATNNGIDHRGDGTITLKAENGNNIIKTTNGDGIRVEGPGKVEFNAENNEITAGDNGIQVAGGGIVNVTAITGDNTINAMYNGIYASGESSIVTMNGKNNIIIVNDSAAVDNDNGETHPAGVYTNGIHVIDGANYIITKNDANNTIIDITASTHRAHGILAENNSNVDIDTNNFTLNLKGDVKESPTGGSDVYGVYSDQSNVDVNASGSVSINIDNYGGNENIANGYGVRAVYGHTTSGDIITDFENTKLNITGSDITINSIVHKEMSLPGAVGLSAESGVGNYYSDNDKKVVVDIIATGEKGINIKAQSSGTATGVQVSDNSGVTIKADNGDVNISAIGADATSNDAIFVNSLTISNSKYDLKTQVHVSGINNNITATGTGTAVRGEYGKSFIDITANGGNNFIRSSNTTVYSAYGADVDLKAEQGINDISGKTGIYAVSGTVDLNAINNSIKANNYGLYALYADSNISLNSILGNDVNTDGESGYGVRSYGENAVVTLNSTEGNNKIVSKYRGVLAQNSSDVNITADIGSNNINADNDYAIFSTDSSDVSLTAGLNNIVSGKTYGVVVKNASTALEAEKSNFVSSDNMSVYAYTSADVDLTADNSNILYAGELNSGYGKSYAINAIGQSDVDLTAGETNLLRGAVYASGSTDTAKTDVTIGGGANMVLSNAYIANAGGLTDKNVISALYAEKGANISLDGDYNILGTYAVSSSDDLERVVWAYDTADISVTGLTAISTDSYDLATNSKDIAVVAGTATGLEELSADEILGYSGDRANVDINYESDSSITGDILSAYAGTVNIAANTETTRAASDSKIDIRGNLLAGNNGILNVDLGNGGTLTGRADDYGDAGLDTGHGAATGTENSFFNPAFSSEIIANGTVNLTMGEGSVWNVTGQSWITELNTTANAEDTLINLENAKEDYNTSASALTIGTLNGSTQFYMNLDGDRSASDMLYIKNANGKYDIYLQEEVTTGEINANGFKGLRFATVGEDSNADFTVKSQGTGSAFDVVYTVGTDSYAGNEENTAYNSTTGGNANTEKPGNVSVNDFFGLTDTATEETPEAATNGIMLMAENEEAADNAANADTGLNEVTNFKIIARAGEELNDTGETILNMSRANYSNAIYMDRLNKRLGEARYINGEEDEGMWVRIRHDRIGKTDAYRSQNTMYELGYDKKQDCDNGERRVGFAVDYMHGDTGYSDIAGKGEIDRYGLWLYDTWMGDKGHYVDYVAKWGHLSNDFEVYTMRNGDKVTGDYSNNVFSVSAEYGRKKDMGNDWYFEPQAQLQLARVTGADYTTNQGTKVSVDGINSLIGRAGFRLGKDFGEEKQSTVYIKADVLHEFLGDQDVYVYDKSSDNKWAGISYENEGTWYDVGFGFATMMSKNSYAFLDLEKSFGHDNDETYQINAGVQWTF